MTHFSHPVHPPNQGVRHRTTSPIPAVALIELTQEFGLGLHREMAVDLLDVAGEGILGDLKIGGDLLATATLEKEFEDKPFARGELGNRDGSIIRPSHLMEPGNLTQDDVGNTAVAGRESIGRISAIDPNTTDRLLIDRTIGDDHAANTGLLP